LLLTTALLAALVGEQPFPPVTPRNLDSRPHRFRPASSLRGTVSRASDPMVVGPLASEEIVAVVAGHQRELEYCYDRRLTTEPELAGQVDVMFVVSGIGTVASARVASSSANDPALENCVAVWFLGMQFPAPTRGQRVVVRYPLLFTPRLDPTFPGSQPGCDAPNVVR
jgi:hypothetical protein